MTSLEQVTFRLVPSVEANYGQLAGISLHKNLMSNRPPRPQLVERIQTVHDAT